ncbi:MAG: NAD(P)-dependent oxidoreductase [Anaerolineaceae bacterium]|nr:NAD(P)-dependent oxidoreductase [Anaerolineaceae bacterium]
MENIGILHPGEMGSSIAWNAQISGHTLFWVSDGRSPETRMRAEKLSLTETKSLEELVQNCSILISVCPPHAAEEVAGQVCTTSFQGLYADLNAISPQRAVCIGEMMQSHGIIFVDGGIIGGPAWKPGDTWLHLSGSEAQSVAGLFSGGPLQTEVIGDEIGKASALKMCFAAYTKGSTALLCAILAAAEGLDVRRELEQQWSSDGSNFAEQTRQRVTRVTAKAWRFSGEMEEIAATFSETGLPGGFHQAAAEIYSRMADFKNQPSPPDLAEVLSALLNRS